LNQFYKYVNSRTHNKNGIPPIADNNGQLCWDDYTKAEILNSAFASVFTVDNGKLPPPILIPIVTNPYGGIVCTPDMIRHTILKMKCSKSAGHDLLPVLFYKKLCAQLAYPLCVVFNISLSTSDLPLAWKFSIIVPVFKKGKSSDPLNYRPISLTPVVCKILETIVKHNVLSYFTCNSLISKDQYGFLANRSTTTQLLDCTSHWVKHIAAKQQVDAIYLDFAKAFDSIVHEKLLFKLQCYGINGLTLLWIKSFLANRTQRVRVGASLSRPINVISGVPQGSVLGPLLFLVFINDLCKITDNAADVILKLFADDVKLFSPVSNQLQSDNLQLCLNDIFEWCMLWQLNLSANKCVVLSLGSKPVAYKYYVNNVELLNVTNYNDLGICVDSGLSFESHINTVCSKGNQRAALIFKVFKSRDPKLLFRAFATFVRPILESVMLIKTFSIKTKTRPRPQLARPRQDQDLNLSRPRQDQDFNLSRPRQDQDLNLTRPRQDQDLNCQDQDETKTLHIDSLIGQEHDPQQCTLTVS